MVERTNDGNCKETKHGTRVEKQSEQCKNRLRRPALQGGKVGIQFYFINL